MFTRTQKPILAILICAVALRLTEGSPELTAYWDMTNCGPYGNDHNADFCDFHAKPIVCPQNISVSTSTCGSGKAHLATFQGTGYWASLFIDNCVYAFYAEYACDPQAGPGALQVAEVTGVAGITSTLPTTTIAAASSIVPTTTALVGPPELTAYWDMSDCGLYAHGHNADLCDFEARPIVCPQHITVKTSTCGSGTAHLAKLKTWEGAGCVYAQYACDPQVNDTSGISGSGTVVSGSATTTMSTTQFSKRLPGPLAMTTTTVTSETASQQIEVEAEGQTSVAGTIKMDVNDPMTFTTDPVVKSAIGTGIASIAGVPPSYVTLELLLPSGRRLVLVDGQVLGRRMQEQASTTVEVSYTIHIPSWLSHSAQRIASGVAGTPVTTMTEILRAELVAQAGSGRFVVSVTELIPPTVNKQEVAGGTVNPIAADGESQTGLASGGEYILLVLVCSGVILLATLCHMRFRRKRALAPGKMDEEFGWWNEPAVVDWRIEGKQDEDSDLCMEVDPKHCESVIVGDRRAGAKELDETLMLLAPEECRTQSLETAERLHGIAWSEDSEVAEENKNRIKEMSGEDRGEVSAAESSDDQFKI